MPEEGKGVWTIAVFDGVWSNQQLMKDCGLVPYMFHRVYGFRPAMLGRSAGEEYTNLTKMPGMRLEFLPVSAEGYPDARLRFMREHSGEMDLLVLTGPYHEYTALLSEYRKLRPDGKVYMALDMNSYWADSINRDDPWFTELLGACDVIAASCRRMQEELTRRWERWTIHTIPNGFVNLTGTPLSVSFEQKENIILTVGRIGSAQKANHILLEAFAAARPEIGDWRLHLVGKIDEPFRPYIDQYFAAYPELRERVVFKGLIADKAELYAEYARAKVFALTSILEGGAPNVVAEALFHGCYTVTSDIDAAGDITADGACGRVFPCGDVPALADIFREICPDGALFRNAFPETVAYARRFYDWEVNIKRLYRLLYEGNKM
ncbi:MAG: glycosyltransferase family 4 protein [Oscillospiraceae bacterium]|jgi:glycosyltransferase involved in cell wall biosynthesis|nr:glycosyltransferase family 4 protein [Oscillospiraceae bacterium]